VTDLGIRLVEQDEYRAASNLFRQALHHGPMPDDQWEYSARSYEAGRLFGAVRGDTLVGVATSYGSRLTVPGGRALPMAAVTRVGVRADHTRRGVLTALMRHQLHDCRDRGEPFATLRASEAVIYGRFGYGVATRGRTLAVSPERAVPHPDAPTGGTVRLLDRDEIGKVLPPLYERIGAPRPGMMTRPAGWWEAVLHRPLGTGENLVAAVHSGADGDDGFVLYQPKRKDGAEDFRAVLEVLDLHAATVEASAALWRFLTRVDLVCRIEAWLRPLDEPVEWLFTDLRAVRTRKVEDETWLRLVDVPVALTAREYGDADPVVIEVHDTVLPDNAGRYRICADGVERTDAPADLELDVATLASVYLGDVPPSLLAAVGRVVVHDAAAPARADRLFGSTVVPWCGTFF